MRLAHLGDRRLMELEKQGLLRDDKIQKIEFCDYCILGKENRVKFGQGKHTSTRPMEYIHSDLWVHPRHILMGVVTFLCP